MKLLLWIYLKRQFHHWNDPRDAWLVTSKACHDLSSLGHLLDLSDIKSEWTDQNIKQQFLWKCTFGTFICKKVIFSKVYYSKINFTKVYFLKVIFLNVCANLSKVYPGIIASLLKGTKINLHDFTKKGNMQSQKVQIRKLKVPPRWVAIHFITPPTILTDCTDCSARNKSQRSALKIKWSEIFF